MKYNILTFLAAALMVAVATTALSSGMWIYEQSQLETEEMRTPTTISNSIGTIYSNSTQEDEESLNDGTGDGAGASLTTPEGENRELTGEDGSGD